MLLYYNASWLTTYNATVNAQLRIHCANNGFYEYYVNSQDLLTTIQIIIIILANNQSLQIY